MNVSLKKIITFFNKSSRPLYPGVFLLFIGLFGIIGLGIIFFNKSFPLRYIAPLVMLCLPFSFQILEGQSSIAFPEKKEKNLTFKRVLFLILTGISIWIGGESAGTLVILLGIASLIFGIDARISFFFALLSLFGIVLALLVKEQAIAESFSIILYYLLCIGVVVELVGENIISLLSSDYFCFSKIKLSLSAKIQTKIPTNILNLWKEYGKETLLILYVGILFFCFQTKVLQLFNWHGIMISLSIFAFLYRIIGKELWTELKQYISWLTKGIMIIVFGGFFFNFFIPQLQLPYRPIILTLWSIGVIIDYFRGEKEFMWNYKILPSPHTVSRVEVLINSIILLLAGIAYFSSYKIALLLASIIILIIGRKVLSMIKLPEKIKKFFTYLEKLDESN